MANRLIVYNFIVEFALKNQYYPSYREICQGVGYASTQTVCHAIKELSEQGLLELKGSRAYKVKDLEIRRRG